LLAPPEVSIPESVDRLHSCTRTWASFEFWRDFDLELNHRVNRIRDPFCYPVKRVRAHRNNAEVAWVPAEGNPFNSLAEARDNSFHIPCPCSCQQLVEFAIILHGLMGLPSSFGLGTRGYYS